MDEIDSIGSTRIESGKKVIVMVRVRFEVEVMVRFEVMVMVMVMVRVWVWESPLFIFYIFDLS